MALRLPNGKEACTPKENMSVVELHFMKQFNIQRPRYANAAKLIAQREDMITLDCDISFEEFKKEGVMKLQNNRAPGVIGVPSQTFKLLGNVNLKYIYRYAVDFWSGTADYCQ